MSNRRKRTRGVSDAPPPDTLIVTAVRAAEIESPDEEPMYGLDISGVSLDAPEDEVARSFVLSREALHAIVAELHKAEGIA